MSLASFFVCTWGEPGNKANYILHVRLMLRWSGAPSCTTVWLGLAGVTKQRSVYLLSIFAACLLSIFAQYIACSNTHCCDTKVDVQIHCCEERANLIGPYHGREVNPGNLTWFTRPFLGKRLT